ncbi:MAG: DUF308 domain-containing protein [Candidatus Saccharibacteria bacterium]|nr:DUF308 domain-containing protein [Candidatus Saccharibacteria bacterium]
MVKYKSVESHWQLLVCQGIASLIIGCIILFLDSVSAQTLVTIISLTLLFLGISDLIHLFIRRRHQEGWGISLLITAFEIIISSALLITNESELFWQMLILATYTFTRGVFDLVFAFKSIKNSTDKFILVFSGICSCVIGLITLNANAFAEKTLFIHLFGTYLMIFGLSNTVYGFHNKNLASDAAKKSKKKSSASSKQSKPSKSSKSTKVKKKGGKK